MVEETVEGGGTSCTPRLWPSSTSTSAGRRVIVVSSSPMEIVAPLCRYLGLEDIIATLPEVGEDGRYTGEIQFYAYGPGKAEAMREFAATEGISLEESFAYSDSITDLPMLEAVGHPVAVNPDRELRTIAEEKDWQILHFEREVEVADASPTCPTRPDDLRGRWWAWRRRWQCGHCRNRSDIRSAIKPRRRLGHMQLISPSLPSCCSGRRQSPPRPPIAPNTGNHLPGWVTDDAGTGRP